MITGIEEFINADLNDPKYLDNEHLADIHVCNNNIEFDVDENNPNIIYIYKGDMVYIYDTNDKDDIKELKNFCPLI